MALLVLLAISAQAAPVVVYTSQERAFAEPLFQRFTKETGIEVKAVYDGEAAKNGGWVALLLAEKSRPRCDLFWNNEQLRTAQLAQAGVLDAATVTHFAHRQRQFVIRRGAITNDVVPYTLAGLTNAALRGRVALASPVRGTTGAHLLALRERWGAHLWENWCRAVAGNRPLLVDDGSAVVRTIASGRALIGLADSDEIRRGQREGLDIMPMSLSADDGLSIRNSAALVVGAPNPQAARRLLSYLASVPVLQRLAETGAIDPLTVSEGGEDLCGCDSDSDLVFAPWETVAERMGPGIASLKAHFFGPSRSPDRTGETEDNDARPARSPRILPGKP